MHPSMRMLWTEAFLRFGIMCNQPMPKAKRLLCGNSHPELVKHDLGREANHHKHGIRKNCKRIVRSHRRPNARTRANKYLNRERFRSRVVEWPFHESLFTTARDANT